MKNISKDFAGAWLMLIVGAFAYIGAVQQLSATSRERVPDKLAVVVPSIVQIILNGGDKYLAANSGVFRAVVLTVNDELEPEELAVLAQIQVESSRLNPAHEDNYYLAQAFLTWRGQANPSMKILSEAAVGRPYDAWPLFFRGFNYYYFFHQPKLAATDLWAAGLREPESASYFQGLAAKWGEKIPDADAAISMLAGMRALTKDEKMKTVLGLRIERLKNMALLQRAVAAFRARENRLPVAWNELVQKGFLVGVPQDPLGQSYTLNSAGEVMVAGRRK